MAEGDGEGFSLVYIPSQSFRLTAEIQLPTRGAFGGTGPDGPVPKLTKLLAAINVAPTCAVSYFNI